MLSNNHPVLHQTKDSAGFTLLELTIVLVIVGVLLAAAMKIVIPMMHAKTMIETSQKLDNIAKAIDFYARQNLRIPCPALPDSGAANPPFGYEMGSGPAGDNIPSDCGAVQAGWEGIVPFKTLNIPAEWIKDGWGNHITYAISPGFSQDVGNTAIPVHRRCRTADWFVGSIIYEPGVTEPGGNPAQSSFAPRNDRKARFCCSGLLIGNDLLIRDANDQPQMTFTRQAAAASYAAANVTYPNPMQANVQVPNNDRVSTPVYVLVSHGPNGSGAYTGQGGGRVPLAPATPNEAGNADGDRIFYEIPKINRAGAELPFDDEVLWRTQDAIFASGKESCSLP